MSQHSSTKIPNAINLEMLLNTDNFTAYVRSLSTIMTATGLEALLCRVDGLINDDGVIDVDEAVPHVNDLLLGLLLRKAEPRVSLSSGVLPLRSLDEFINFHNKLFDAVSASPDSAQFYVWLSRFLAVEEMDWAWWSILECWSSAPPILRTVWCRADCAAGLLTFQTSVDNRPMVDRGSLIRTAIIVNTQRLGNYVPGPDPGLVTDNAWVMYDDVTPPSSVTSLSKTKVQRARSPSQESVNSDTGAQPRSSVVIGAADGLLRHTWRFQHDDEAVDSLGSVMFSQQVPRFYIEGVNALNNNNSRPNSGNLEIQNLSPYTPKLERARSGELDFGNIKDDQKRHSGEFKLPALFSRQSSRDSVFVGTAGGRSSSVTSANHMVECGLALLRCGTGDISKWRDVVWECFWNADINEGLNIGLSWLITSVFSLLQEHQSANKQKETVPSGSWMPGWVNIWVSYAERLDIYNHGNKLAPAAPGDIISRLLRPQHSSSLSESISPGSREIAESLTNWIGTSELYFGVPTPEERDIWEYTIVGLCVGCCNSLGLTVPVPWSGKCSLPRRKGQSTRAVIAGVEALTSIIHPELIPCLNSGGLPLSVIIHSWVSRCFVSVLDWPDVLRSMCWRWLSGDQGDVFVCLCILTHIKTLIPWLVECDIVHALLTSPSRYLDAFSLINYAANVTEWQYLYGKLLASICQNV